MPHARAGARCTTLRALATAVASLVVLAGVAATTPAATAVPGRVPVIEVAQDMTWLSPNGDKSRDRARYSFRLTERSRVIVRLYRGYTLANPISEEHLGVLAAGRHRWVWDGTKHHNGRVVRDGKYTVTFTARQVGPEGRWKRVWVAPTVDTELTPITPTLSSDTVDPRTSHAIEPVEVVLQEESRLATIRRVTMKVRNARGRVVRTEHATVEQPYLKARVTVPFDGCDDDGFPLPRGRYTIRFDMTDRAGNEGKSRRVVVNVT